MGESVILQLIAQHGVQCRAAVFDKACVGQWVNAQRAQGDDHLRGAFAVGSAHAAVIAGIGLHGAQQRQRTIGGCLCVGMVCQGRHQGLQRHGGHIRVALRPHNGPAAIG